VRRRWPRGNPLTWDITIYIDLNTNSLLFLCLIITCGHSTFAGTPRSYGEMALRTAIRRGLQPPRRPEEAA